MRPIERARPYYWLAHAVAASVAICAIVYVGLVLVFAAQAQAAVIEGGPGHDELEGTPHADTIRGHGGDDFILGRAGWDVLEGGYGIDILYGHWGDDRLRGGYGPDDLHGGDGNDVLYGGPGPDYLDSADGVQDTVFCGDGHDLFVADRFDVLNDCEEES